MKSELTIGSAKANPGTIAFGSIEVGEFIDGMRLSMPIIVANGSNEGPILLLTAAMHGWEVVGIEVIRRVLRKELDVRRLRGAVLAIPAVNPLALQARAYITPQDHADVGGVIPGDPNGTITRRLASALWSVVRKSNYYIDLHCMEGPSIPSTIVRGPPTGEVVDKAIDIARAMDMTITRPSQEARKRRPRTGSDIAMEAGIPSVIVEFPFPAIVMQEEVVQLGVRAILNVMKVLKMIDGQIEKQNGFKNLPGVFSTMMVTCNKGGLTYPLCNPGDSVEEGQAIADIFNLYGDLQEKLTTPVSGYILSYGLNINQAVGTGDAVAYIAFKEKG
jgi:predicted deacylase